MQIVNDWRTVDFNNGVPYVFPEDLAIIQNRKVEYEVFNNIEEYTDWNEFHKDENPLHLGLLPNPYGGNIENASVIILTLNPGFTPSEYSFEYQNQEFRHAIIRAIYQDNMVDEFPFCALNPDFCHHPGFVYWAEKRVETAQRAGNKFKHLAYRIVQTNFQHINTMNDAFKYLSQKIAVLEYFPYHSKSFNGFKGLASRLPSTNRLVNCLRKELIPLAKSGEKLIICMRGPELWNIQDVKHENVIIYPSRLRQSASLTLRSPGGSAIKNFLRIE